MIRTLHGRKMCGKFYPPKTNLREATLTETRTIFPNIRLDESSPFCCVWFPEMKHPTLVLQSELNPDYFEI